MIQESTTKFQRRPGLIRKLHGIAISEERKGYRSARGQGSAAELRKSKEVLGLKLPALAV